MVKIVLRTVDGITYRGQLDYLRDGYFYVNEVVAIQGDGILMPDFEQNGRFLKTVKFNESTVVWYYTDGKYL